VEQSQITLQLNHDGRSGEIDLDFQEENDSTIEIRFVDRLYDNSGTIRLVDGEMSNAVITTGMPYAGVLADSEAYKQYFDSILSRFSHAFPLSQSNDLEQVIIHDEDYPKGNPDTDGDSKEIELRSVQATLIDELADPGKCVIAGCANGELVRQCRRQGIDAHGFDGMPNLKEIAYEEVRDFVRVGSLTQIPYDASDGFETLIAVDVLEHMPEQDIPKMVEEWTRIGVKKLVLLINMNQAWFPGHVSLRPVTWWASQWKSCFTLSQTVRKDDSLGQTFSNTSSYSQQWTFWERVLM
jgi:hypothetical protein